MTDQPDVRKIAGKLSKAQREALIRHPAASYYGTARQGWPQPTRDPTSFCYAGRALMDAGLLAWAPMPHDSRTRLTSLGLAVRAILQEKHNEPSR